MWQGLSSCMPLWSMLALSSDPDFSQLSQEKPVFSLFLHNNVMRGFKHLVFLLGSAEGCLS